MRKLLPIVLLFLLSVQLNAQSSIRESQQDTLEIYFRQGLSLWDAEYKDNGKNLEAFVERFKKVTEKNEMQRITKIHIVATCSPEGFYDFNKRLAKNRAASIRKVLNGYLELPDSVIVERAIAINWDGLRKMVVADPNVPFQKEVLDIIDNSPELYTNPEGKILELRKQRLIWRYDGEAWKYMYEKFFPTLRSYNLQIVVEWEKIKLPAVSPIIAKTDRIPVDYSFKLLPPPPPPTTTKNTSITT